MGNDDTISDENRDFLDAIDVEGRNQSEQIEALRERNRLLEEKVEDQEAEIQDLRDELTGVKQTLFSEINDLKARLDGQDPTDPRANNYYEDLTILEKYAEMTQEEREELLSGNTSKLRAVMIFENWRSWAKRVDAGWLINTNHTRGSYGKSGIKIDLEEETGEDLQSNEVYRAMRMVAKLSAKDTDDVEVLTDSYGRKHITGGAFEYHEKVNPDADGQNRKFKVLKLVDEEAISLP